MARVKDYFIVLELLTSQSTVAQQHRKGMINVLR